MSETIWTVSTLGLHGDIRRRVSSRCWGYYFTWDQALQGMRCHCDSEMGYYTHAVIEQFKPGIYANCSVEEWFKFEGDVLVKCAKPESEKHICNYAIG